MSNPQQIIDNYVSKIEDGGEDVSNNAEPTEWRGITDDEQDALLTLHRKLAARSEPGPKRHRDLIGCNFRLARDLDVDITHGFDDENAAEQVVGYINSKWDSPETRRDYRRHYVSLGRLVTPGEETPEAMQFVNTGYDGGYDRTPDPADMIRLDEMRIIADACHNPRDAALIALAWDSGARAGELYRMRYQDLREYKVGYQAFVRESKTDTRNVKPLIHSVEYIQKWLDEHPAPERDVPLWCDLTVADDEEPKRISQKYFSDIFREAMERVDVDRPHECRYYRKSMQAFLASRNVNEAHINIRAGRNPTSDEAKRYTTVFGDEHVSQVASAYGVEVDRSTIYRYCNS
jgi:integrase